MSKKKTKTVYHNAYQGNDPLLSSMCGVIPASGDMPESAASFIASGLKMVLKREGLDEDLSIDQYHDSVSANFKHTIYYFDGSDCNDVNVTLTVKRDGAVAEFEAETYHGGGRYTENNLEIDTFDGLREVVLRRCREVLLGAWKETAEDIEQNIKYLNEKLVKGDFDY